MSKCELRNVFTVLLYAGVAIVFFPYFTGHLSAAILFLIVGVTLSLVSGLLRCYLTEGDCTDRTASRYIP